MGFDRAERFGERIGFEFSDGDIVTIACQHASYGRAYAIRCAGNQGRALRRFLKGNVM